MTKEITLQFDRSQDVHTDYYYIYRATTPEVSRRSTRVMKIKQLTKPNFIPALETAVRINSKTYRVSHKNISPKNIIVGINGIEMKDPKYQIDYQNGIIQFDEDVNEEDTVDMSYLFDGIEVVDDFHTNGHLDLNYYGPPAKDDTRPEAPSHYSILPLTNGNVEIKYTPFSAKGITFYYAIEARNEQNDFSFLSDAFPVFVKAETKHTVIETSRDGVTWQEAGMSQTNIYHDLKADNEPPEGLTNVAFTKKTVTGGTEITFTWKSPLPNNKPAQTPRYRLRTVLDNENVSEPTKVMGPEQITSSLDKVVILRKLGSLAPVYTDSSAEKIVDLTNYDAGRFVHVASAGKTYSYSLFVVDAAGNYSIASTHTIST